MSSAIPLYFQILKMKQIILFSLISVLFLYSCNEKNNKQNNTSSDYNYEHIVRNTYQLIRPMEFDAHSIDMYGLPLDSNSWYLCTRKTNFYLLPFKDRYKMDLQWLHVLFMQNKISYDTINPVLLVSTNQHDGFRGIKRIVVAVPFNGEFYPSTSSVDVGVYLKE